MREIWIRFSIILLLWIGMMQQADAQIVAVVMLAAASSLALSFLLPLSSRPLLFYLAQSVLVFASVNAAGKSEAGFLLLLYFAAEAAFFLPKRIFIIQLSVSALLLTALIFFVHPLPLGWGVIFVLLSGLLIKVNSMNFALMEQRALYGQLLDEYRQLKRSAIAQEQTARSEERTRIARDMHDSVGHKLTALLMQLEMDDLNGEYQSIGELKALARESLEDTRQAVRHLKEEELSGIASVIHLIRKLEAGSHLLVRFTTENGVLSAQLTNDQSVVLYRVLQESLTNAMKHGASREVDVVLGLSPIGGLRFSIRNKLEADKQHATGFGLTNMRARTEEIGGILRILRTEEHFIVEGSFPLKE